MAEHPVFNRETLLDSVVNLVPLGILLFFLALFLLVNPWTDLPNLAGLVSLALVVVPFAILVYVTYETALRI